MTFCCNSLCQFHLEAGDSNRLKWDIAGKLCDVRQYTIVDTATGRRLHFCEVCTNAVAMANEKHETKEQREEG
jgi:hypothetical protein